MSDVLPRPVVARPAPAGILKVRYRIELLLFDTLSATAGRLSPRARRILASAIGTIVWAVDVRHRRVAQANVRLAYGDALTSAQQRRLVRASMRHLVRVAIETLAVRTWVADDGEHTIVVQGLDHLRTAAASGKGAILMTAHLGHWELLALVGGHLGPPVNVIARPLDNPYLEARLLARRSLSGNRVIHKRGAFPVARRVLLGGGFLGLLIDQRPKRGGIPVPFFGATAYVTDGLARLVLDTDAVVLPCFGVIESDGSAQVTIDPPIAVVKTGDRVADAYRVTAECTAVVERWVRRYPEQWLWTHRRWARPKPGEPRLAPSEDDRVA